MVKNPCINPGDVGLIPRLGRSPGGGHGNPLQYPCLETPLDRGACWATVHWVTKSLTRPSPQHTHVQISILVLCPQVQPTLAPSDYSSLVSLAQRRLVLLILSLKNARDLNNKRLFLTLLGAGSLSLWCHHGQSFSSLRLLSISGAGGDP